MSDIFKGQNTVYAVVQVDQLGNLDLPEEQRIIVKEIVFDFELAKAEVQRLNHLNANKSCRYFWQTTRLYPAGTSAGTSLLSPWESIRESNEAANNLHKELQRELAPDHALYGKRVEAIARRIDNDDVLFKMLDDSNQYVVVHLTWTGDKENNIEFPWATFFPNFETWIIECMEKDHQEQNNC
jgi:hypothetical protein